MNEEFSHSLTHVRNLRKYKISPPWNILQMANDLSLRVVIPRGRNDNYPRHASLRSRFDRHSVGLSLFHKWSGLGR
jgi:hypothetical protein